MADDLAVVDASAVAALLFGEPQGAKVAEALQERELIAPTLLRYELGSVCLKKRKLYPDQRDALLLALSLLDRMNVREATVREREVVELAEREELTYYDAAYLWLAQEVGADLITLDTRQSERRPPDRA